MEKGKHVEEEDSTRIMSIASVTDIEVDVEVLLCRLIGSLDVNEAWDG